MKSEAHVSPDGTLVFLVVRTPDGDITMGFEGYPWHTHGDVVPGGSEDAEAATARFVGDLLAGRSIVAISTVGGAISDVWITEDPAEETRFCEPGETLAFRLWDGTAIEG